MLKSASPALDLAAKCAPEQDVLHRLIGEAGPDDALRQAITARATTLVERIRTESNPTLMEHFLAEYGLSTKEGVALMCLAEAMLRVPDAFTIDKGGGARGDGLAQCVVGSGLSDQPMQNVLFGRALG
ncbi:MAG: hypothetical protein AAFY31_11970, partial [Pseudomonadota bacterium]